MIYEIDYEDHIVRSLQPICDQVAPYPLFVEVVVRVDAYDNHFHRGFFCQTIRKRGIYPSDPSVTGYIFYFKNFDGRWAQAFVNDIDIIEGTIKIISFEESITHPDEFVRSQAMKYHPDRLV